MGYHTVPNSKEPKILYLDFDSKLWQFIECFTDFATAPDRTLLI
jgi:hypothetical protein